MEIGLPQCRQRPRRSSQDTTGMSSRGVIGSSHLGQCDRGRTTDSPRGTRQMTTLRNDPMSSPNTPHTTARYVVTASSYRGCVANGFATQPSVQNLALVEDVGGVGQHPLRDDGPENGDRHVVGVGLVVDVRRATGVDLAVGRALVGFVHVTRRIE